MCDMGLNENSEDIEETRKIAQHVALGASWKNMKEPKSEKTE